MDELSPADRAARTAGRKIDRRLIPLLLLMYVLAFLDRTNVSFAQESFQADIGISAGAYAFGASVFFLGYAFLEVPSNLILVRVGARRWLARIMVTWGLVSAAMMFADGARAFYALRFLLGVCEAGFFPGVIFYLTRWYPQRDRARAIGLFYFGAPLSLILGGPLSGLLLQMDGAGGLAGWQWLFMIEGLGASAVGLWAWFHLPERPADARWLNREEKAALLTHLPPDAQEHHGERVADVLRTLGDRRVLHLALIYLLIQMSVYGVVFFLPAQIAGLIQARVGLTVGLLSALPWLCALAATWVLPRIAQRTGRLREAAALLLLIAGGGIAASVAGDSPILGLIALSFAASGFIAAQPIFWAVAASLLTGARAAAAIALVNSVGAIGAFVAPNARVLADARLPGVADAGMYLLALLTVLGGALMLAAPRGRIQV